MRYSLKIVLTAVTILLALLCFLLLLQMHRFEKLLIEVNSNLVSVPAKALKADIERTLAFGLPLSDNLQIKSMLQRIDDTSDSVISIHVVDAYFSPGKIIWEVGKPLPAEEPLFIVLAQRLNKKSMWFGDQDPIGYLQSWPIVDPIGNIMANLVIRFDKTHPQQLILKTRQYLYTVCGVICLCMLLLLLPFLTYVLKKLNRQVALAQRIIEGERAVDPQLSAQSDICQLATQMVSDTQLRIKGQI
jgi:hypothetical protein